MLTDFFFLPKDVKNVKEILPVEKLSVKDFEDLWNHPSCDLTVLKEELYSVVPEHDLRDCFGVKSFQQGISQILLSYNAYGVFREDEYAEHEIDKIKVSNPHQRDCFLMKFPFKTKAEPIFVISTPSFLRNSWSFCQPWLVSGLVAVLTSTKVEVVSDSWAAKWTHPTRSWAIEGKDFEGQTKEFTVKFPEFSIKVFAPEKRFDDHFLEALVLAYSFGLKSGSELKKILEEYLRKHKISFTELTSGKNTNEIQDQN